MVDPRRGGYLAPTAAAGPGPRRRHLHPGDQARAERDVHRLPAVTVVGARDEEGLTEHGRESQRRSPRRRPHLPRKARPRPGARPSASSRLGPTCAAVRPLPQCPSARGTGSRPGTGPTRGEHQAALVCRRSPVGCLRRSGQPATGLGGDDQRRRRRWAGVRCRATGQKESDSRHHREEPCHVLLTRSVQARLQSPRPTLDQDEPHISKTA